MAAKTERIGLDTPITLTQAGALCGLSRFALHRRVAAGKLVTVVADDGRHFTTRRHLKAMLDAQKQSQRALKQRLALNSTG
jgi:hypothetical protein